MCVWECTQKCVLSVHNGSAWCAHNAPAESSRALLLNREREGKNKGGLRALQSRRMTFRALGVQSSLSAFVLPSLNIINNISSRKKKGWGASRISTPLISLCRWFFFLSFASLLYACTFILCCSFIQNKQLCPFLSKNTDKNMKREMCCCIETKQQHILSPFYFDDIKSQICFQNSSYQLLAMCYC